MEKKEYSSLISVDTNGFNNAMNFVSVFANEFDWLSNYIDWRSLGCAVWTAAWGNSDPLQGYMWQYTDKLYIPGASRTELFDANILYMPETE